MCCFFVCFFVCFYSKHHVSTWFSCCSDSLFNKNNLSSVEKKDFFIFLNANTAIEISE